MAKLAQRLRLDLTDALASHVEFAAHFFERSGAPVFETEPQLQHAPLAAGQAFEDRLRLLLEQLVRRRVARRESLVVGDEVPEVRILFLADRRLQRHGLLRHLHDLADLVGRDEHPFRDLLRGRLAPELLKESARDADELVDRLDHVDRDADRPRLVRDGAGDGLSDPPRRVRRELVSLAVVELLDRADETDVSFLDQVEEAHAAADVLLRDRDNETKVRLGQVVPRVVAFLDELVGETAQRALLVRVELRELVEVLHENVAKLRSEHDELAETLRAFGRPVDLRVLRQDPERETFGIAARSVDESDGLVDEHLRLVADLFAVRFALKRIAKLEEPVRDAPELLAALLVAEREAERLVREARGLVDELLRTSERHALLHFDTELVQVDHRQRRRYKRLLAELDRLGEVDLFLGREQRDLPDLLEIHADRVVDADEVRGQDRRDRVLALELLGLFLFLLDLRPRGRALGLEDLDVVVVEGREKLFDLAGLGIRDRPNDVFLSDVALLPTARDEALGCLAVLRVDPALLGRRRCCRCRFLDLGAALHSSLSSASAACKTVCRSRRCMSSASSFASSATCPSTAPASPPL